MAAVVLDFFPIHRRESYVAMAVTSKCFRNTAQGDSELFPE